MTAVAFDVRWAQGESRGGVARGVLSLLRRLGKRLRVIGLADPRRGALADLDVEIRWLGLPFGSPAVAWLETVVPLALRNFDGIFHSPFYMLPRFCPVAGVVTMHDVSFETHRHLFSASKGALFRAKAKSAAKRAARIIAVSEWVRGQIVELYGVPAERVSLVQNGVEPAFQPLRDADRERFACLLGAVGITRPYLATMGGAARRGAAIAIDAWSELVRRGYPHQLLVFGEQGPPSHGIVRLAPNDDTYRLLLSGADLLLYPTEMEGFGLPGLEAAACGTPSVCAPIGPLPEVLGNAALWCDRDAAAIAAMADRALSDSSLMARHVRAGIERAAGFTWDKAADDLVCVYEEVAAEEYRAKHRRQSR